MMEGLPQRYLAGISSEMKELQKSVVHVQKLSRIKSATELHEIK